MTTELELLGMVDDEIHRIVVNGNGPPVFAFNPDPENPCPAEITLAVDLGETDGCRKIVHLGSFWLVPNLLERLKQIVSVSSSINVAEILYALHEFSSDIEVTFSRMDSEEMSSDN